MSTVQSLVVAETRAADSRTVILTKLLLTKPAILTLVAHETNTGKSELNALPLSKRA